MALYVALAVIVVFAVIVAIFDDKLPVLNVTVADPYPELGDAVAYIFVPFNTYALLLLNDTFPPLELSYFAVNVAFVCTLVTVLTTIVALFADTLPFVVASFAHT